MAGKIDRDLVVIDTDIAEALRRHAKHQHPLEKKFQSVTIDNLLDERFALSPVPTPTAELERILDSVNTN